MPATAPSARDKGIEFLRNGLFAESVTFLEQALSEDPSDVDLYIYTAYAYASLNEIDKCVETLEKAVDLAPTSAKVHYNLGVAYHKAKNLTGAKDEFKRALGLDPTYTLAKQALESIAGEQEGQTT